MSGGLDVSGLLALVGLIAIVALLLRGVFRATGKRKPIRRSLNANWVDDRDTLQPRPAAVEVDGGSDGGASND